MIKQFKQLISPLRRLVYVTRGKKPWSYGYNDSRWGFIKQVINNEYLLNLFSKDKLNIPHGFGIGFDERVVEYPFILSRLSADENKLLLDAGSTFNFPEIISTKQIQAKQVTIFTYYPENNNFSEDRISYAYGDLRNMPFKSALFDEVVCQSTLEHIDMDNSIYGYELSKNEYETRKSYEYLKVIDELMRVLKSGGKLLLSFPFGKFENHGFFQQFDAEMVKRVIDRLTNEGKCTENYLLYTANGWIESEAEACKDVVSYNPHSGKGKGSDGAAHCRCICCITYIKNV